MSITVGARAMLAAGGVLLWSAVVAQGATSALPKSCFAVVLAISAQVEATDASGVAATDGTDVSISVGETDRNDPGVGIAIQQRLGAMVPLDTTFRDESGKTVQLQQYFGDRPVILALVYFECPQLCTQILNALTSAMRTISRYEAGTDYQVVAISIDPRETPALAGNKKDAYVRRYGREGGADGLHFLVGDKVEIDRVATAVGYGYRYDPQIDEYAHAAGIMIATPDGRLSRYFYGMDYSGRDIQLALVESSDGKIGSLVDAVRLLCLRYDPNSGKYGFAIMTILRILGLATLAALVVFIVRQVRRERSRSLLDGSSSLSSNLHAAKDPAPEL